MTETISPIVSPTSLSKRSTFSLNVSKLFGTNKSNNNHSPVNIPQTNSNNNSLSSSSSSSSLMSKNSSVSILSNSPTLPTNGNITNNQKNNALLNKNIRNVNISNNITLHSSSHPSTTDSSTASLSSTNSNNNNAIIDNSSTATLTTNTGVGACKRFIFNANGTHTHNLKISKRQEKLSFMIKKMMIGSNSEAKLRSNAKSAVPDIMNTTNAPPTLFLGLMKNIEKTKEINYNNDTTTITKKSQVIERIDEKNFKDKLSNYHQEEQNSKTDSHKDKDLSFADKYGCCKEIIGKGAFGVVRICAKKNDTNKNETLYAVKEFKKDRTESFEKYSKRLTSEFCISSSLKHLNIIHTFDLFQDANKNYFEVMEYCPGGDLFTLIIAAGKLEYAEADCLFKQLIRGVNYMHDMGVAHRDLKPENILLTSDGTLKIVDFGNSECFKMAWEKDIHLSEGICGSSPYIAPEEYTKESFDPRPVDVWSCGVIYMAMRTGRQLWGTAQKDDQFFAKYFSDRKGKHGYEPIENLKRARCRNVIYSMLDPCTYRRITTKQILNSEWVREIKCCNNGQLKKDK